MFKKNAWIAALFLAVAIVFTGCLDPLEEESTAGLVDVTLLDLGLELQKMPVGALGSDAVFGAVFSGLPINPAGNFTDPQVKLAIVDDGGKNVLDVTGVATWGAGVDVDLKKLTLKAGDTIYIKGKLIDGGNFFLNKNPGAGVAKINEWEHTGDGTAFETTQTLNAADLAQANGSNPPAIRLRANGTSHFVIEQLKIVGKRAAGEQPGPGGPGEQGTDYIVPAGGVDADGNEYFYLDLSKMTFGTTQAANSVPESAVTFSRLSTKVDFTENTRANFKLSDEQIAKLMIASKIWIELEGSADPDDGNWRYHIGNPNLGGGWNATGGTPGNAQKFSTLKVKYDLDISSRSAAMLGHFILNKRWAPEGTVTLQSVKITWQKPFNVNSSSPLTLPALDWGNLANKKFSNDQVNAQIIDVTPTPLYKSWDTGKKYPYLDKDKDYTLTIKLSNKGIYSLAGWGTGMPIVVNGAVDNVTSVVTQVGNPFGKINTSYDAETQTIRVQIPKTQTTTQAKEPLIGDYDADAISAWGSSGTTGGKYVIYDSTSGEPTASQFAQAGSTLDIAGGGFNLVGNENGTGNDRWSGGLDIKLKSGAINLDSTSKRYQITVSGVYMDTEGACQMSLAQPDTPYNGVAWSNNMSSTGHQIFNVSYEIPADYFIRGTNGQTAIRVQQGGGSPSDADRFRDFRIVKIVVEDLNRDRVPVTAADLTITAPVFYQTPVTTVTGAPTGTTATLAWKLADDKDASGSFVVGTIYKAVITLTATNPYTFNGLAAAGVKVNDAETDATKKPTVAAPVISANGRIATITATFPATAAGDKIDDDITLTAANFPKINTPLATTAPTITLPASAGFTAGTVAWYRGDSTTAQAIASDANFWGSTVYSAVFSLTISGDNTFKGFNKAVKVIYDTDREAVVTTAISENGINLTVTAKFPATDAPEKIALATSNAYVIDAAYKAGDASSPTVSVYAAAGGSGTFSVGTVSWSPTVSSGLRGETVYKATFKLSATDYANTLDGVTFPTSVIIDGTTTNVGTAVTTIDSTSTLAKSTATVVITLNATGKELITPVEALVETPVVGNGPQQKAIPSGTNAGKFTAGTITWKKGTATVTGNFDVTTGLTAEFTLTANSTYTFGDTPSVTVTGGSVTLTGTGTTINVKVTY
jgi:hypothetical protein